VIFEQLLCVVTALIGDLLFRKLILEIGDLMFCCTLTLGDRDFSLLAIGETLERLCGETEGLADF